MDFAAIKKEVNALILQGLSVSDAIDEISRRHHINAAAILAERIK